MKNRKDNFGFSNYFIYKIWPIQKLFVEHILNASNLAIKKFVESISFFVWIHFGRRTPAACFYLFFLLTSMFWHPLLRQPLEYVHMRLSLHLPEYLLSCWYVFNSFSGLNTASAVGFSSFLSTRSRRTLSDVFSPRENV